MESSISKALWVLADTLPSTCLCQSHWAGCTCQQPAHTSSPTAAAQLSLVCKHKPKSVQSGIGCKEWCWGWAYDPFCQLSYVWQEPPQKQQDIIWQQQSLKQSELTWRLLKTNVSAQLKWPEYLLGDLHKRIVWVFSPHSPVSSFYGLHFPVPTCLHAFVFLTCLWKKKSWKKAPGMSQYLVKLSIKSLHNLGFFPLASGGKYT